MAQLEQLLTTSQRRVIAYVHLLYRQKPKAEWFATSALLEDCRISKTSARRILAKLTDLHLIERRDTGAHNKTYRVNMKRWPENVMDAIDTYELAKRLSL